MRRRETGASRRKRILEPIRADDIPALAAFAESHAIDLTLVGPEVPLSLGVVDEFRKRDLPHHWSLGRRLPIGIE